MAGWVDVSGVEHSENRLFGGAKATGDFNVGGGGLGKSVEKIVKAIPEWAWLALVVVALVELKRRKG